MRIFVTGEQMLNARRHGDQDIRDRWAYLAYVQGAADQAADASVVGNIGGMRLCRLKEATGNELHNVIGQFLEAHPGAEVARRCEHRC